ncbi:MAG: sodium:solute symporter [Clostridia bacterium]|nr:sodium:solute symporter [Clostridia bacterium]
MAIKIIILILFTAITVAIGFFCSKSTKGLGDFVLGGRKIGPWLTAFSYGTSYFSAVVFIGYAGQFGWNFGISALWIGLGNAFIGSLLAWVVLGRRTRVMTKHLDAATMPDFFAKRFDSNSLKIVTALIIFVFLVPYSASVYKGLGGIFSIAFGIDYTWCLIGMAVLTGIYVVVGGYLGTAANSLFQGIVMLIGIVAVLACVLGVNGGLAGTLELLSQKTSETAPNLNGAFVSLFGPDPISLLSVVILTSLGTWGLPQMVHKFYTIKNEKSITTGAVISTVFAVIVAGGSYFLGGLGRLFYDEEKVIFDNIVPTMLQKTLPDALIGIVLILLLAASMSTLSSLVLTSSSTVTLDFLKPLLKKASLFNENKKQVVVIRVLCVLFVLLSLAIALFPNALITSLMSLSWGTLAGCFLGPFLYGLYWKRTTRLSVWISILAGVLLNVANLLFPFTTPTIAGAASMILSLLIIPAVSLITPKMAADKTDAIFSCYLKESVTTQRTALPEEN